MFPNLTWQQFFPDESVFIAVERVATREELVELVVRVSELVEAELPQSHVLEGTLGVLPRDQPVGTGEAHQEQESGDERANRPVEQGI